MFKSHNTESLSTYCMRQNLCASCKVYAQNSVPTDLMLVTTRLKTTPTFGCQPRNSGRKRWTISPCLRRRTLGLPFCQAVRAGDFLFLSGAIGNRPGTLTLVEGGLAAQARQTMENIGEVLKTLRPRIRRYGQIHRHARRHAPVGRIQRGLCRVFRSRAPAGALGLRRERAGARRRGRSRCVAYWPQER